MIEVGDTFPLKNGNTCKVVEYHHSKSIIVEFPSGFRKTVDAGNLRKGSVQEKRESLFTIGEGPYSHRDRRLYNLWKSLQHRCIDPVKYPAYVGCSIDNRWHNFQTFCVDITKMENWDAPGFHLDKDLRVLGNRVYSRSKCSFVPAYVNTLFTGSAKSCYRQRSANCFETGIRHRGKLTRYTFPSKEEAVEFYLSRKIQIVKQAVRKYRDCLHPQVIRNLEKLDEKRLKRLLDMS